MKSPFMEEPGSPPAFHPGETLREDALPALGWTPEQLAERLRVPMHQLREVLAERSPVTPELAMRLGRLFSQTPDFWMGLQIAHDLYVARHSPAARDVQQIEPLRAEPIRKAG